MLVRHINTVEEALAYLQSDGTEEVQIGGELVAFDASIYGENYHGTVPAALARGMWELQEELYRAVAYVLYGGDSYKRLTDEQKAAFELIFAIREGSTDFFATLEGFFTELGKGFQNMDSGHKMKTLVVIALTLTAYFGHQTYSDHQAKLAEIEAEAADKRETRELFAAQQAAQIEQLRVMTELIHRDDAGARFAKAAENGTKAIIKGASDAERIRINKVTFDRNAISEVTQRAAKEPPKADIVIDDYRVVRGDSRDGGVTRFWLMHDNGNEFSGIIVDEDFDARGLNQLWEAFRNRSKLKLQLNLTTVRGQVRNAAILRVIE